MMRGVILSMQVIPALLTILGGVLTFTVAPDAINMAVGSGIGWVLLNVMLLVLWLADRPHPEAAQESQPRAVSMQGPDYPKIRAMEQDLYGEWFTVDGLVERERLRPNRMRRAFEVERESGSWLP